jgi:perosamine synthetase
MGDVSIFSFYPNKLITTGEGGMVVTNDEQIAEACRSLRNLCFQQGKRFVHERLGHNYRMTNLQAGLGLAQLEQIEHFIEKKRQMGSLYTELLSDIDCIELPTEQTDYAQNIYWVYGIVLKDSAPFNAAVLTERLKEYNIGSRPFFYPMHLQPVFKKMGLFEGVSLPVSERLAIQGLYLPSGLGNTIQQFKYVSESLKKIIG